MNPTRAADEMPVSAIECLRLPVVSEVDTVRVTALLVGQVVVVHFFLPSFLQDDFFLREAACGYRTAIRSQRD